MKMVAAIMPLVGLLLSASAFAQSITSIKVRGNSKVEPDAIITLLDSTIGDPLDPEVVKDDIRNLFELGYFSDVRIFKKATAGGIELVVEVKEKPAIVAINFEGFGEVSEDDLKDKLATRLYTIVNEATVASDLRIIEKEYVDKGFYLATATYKLETQGANETTLTYIVDEGGKVRVGDVFILGNKFFTDSDLIEKMMSRPITRASALSSLGSIYQDDFVKRDLEFISLYYRDWGFAKIKVAQPIVQLDSDREYARITFQLEEGLQYSVESIDITGDLLYPKQELIDLMKLKPGELFRYSRFRADVEMLMDKYGDLGYAFVDVESKTPFNDDKKTVALTYNITKGEKVYFGKLNIAGNSKTRDNVVRRELEIADSELYSGTRLRQSKSNIERLGFFEEVQPIKQRDPENAQLLNYTFRVKERPTGQLQAALGFQPGVGAGESSWFGQGRYNEENQSGHGWKLNLILKSNGQKNNDVSLDFTNPRVYDSQWSFGFSLFWQNEVRDITEDVRVEDRRIGGSVTLGRKIIELIRGSITYKISQIKQNSDTFILQKFREEGISSSIILGLRRNSTNNYIDPTSGTDVSLSQNFTGGILGGDHQSMESSARATFFLPVDFTDTYRTYFRFNNFLSYIYPLGDEQVPFFERYKLGGPNDLRGWKFKTLGPKFNILQSPTGSINSFNKGGDKQLFMQLEYFMPLIPEAGIKFLLFTDAGRVYDDDEALGTGGLNHDFGFGFRWITPVAPFRFEWAYPIEDGRPGNLEFIFYLGY